jgi:hypothetical protein
MSRQKIETETSIIRQRASILDLAADRIYIMYIKDRTTQMLFARRIPNS